MPPLSQRQIDRGTRPARSPENKAGARRHRLPAVVVTTLVLGITSPGTAQVPLPDMGAIRNTTGPQFYFLSGGRALDLSITDASPGENPTDVSDNSTELFWDASYGVTSKITISTVCPGQSFSLYADLVVTSWGSGTVATEQSEVSLVDGMMDIDILRDIPPDLPGRTGTGTLTYRAAATVAQGNSSEHGDDHHTVTLTVVAQ